MNYCNACDHTFEEPENVCEYDQKECTVCTEQFEVCPYCGSENFQSVTDLI